MDIPVTILGGYLGAGKTTLINHVLSIPHGARVAVLVNDFGAVNIDASLIAARADETITLRNGCVCCTIQDDLGAAIDEQLRRERPPRHIVIEASGVAEPARLLRHVESWPGLSLDAVVCVIDSETIRERAADKFVGRVVCRQVKSADLLILNKTDLIDAASERDVANWLTDMAPRASIVRSCWGRIEPALLLAGTSTRCASGDGGILNAPPTAFFNATVPMTEPIDLGDLEKTLGHAPRSVHRIKGFVTDITSRRLMLVQCVGARRSITQCTEPMTNAPLALLAIGTNRHDVESVRAELARLGAGREATPNDTRCADAHRARRATAAG